MAFHFLFIVIYFICSKLLTAEEMMYLAIGHGILGLYISARNDKRYVNPHNTNLLTFILINLGNISLIHRIATGTNYMYFFASPEYIDESSLIWCVGNSAFFAGYYMAREASLPKIGIKLHDSHLKYIYYFVLVAGIFSKQILALTFLPAAIIKVLNLSGLLGIMFFARLLAVERKDKYRLWVVILFIVQMYVAFQSYLRFNLILPILVLYLGYFSGKFSIRSFFSYRIIPLAVILVLFVNLFDDFGKSRTRYSRVIVEKYSQLNEDEDQDEVEDLYDVAVDRGGVLDRMSTLGQISACVRLVKDNGFYMGTVSAPLITAIIPRFLWPDKPKIAIGQWFAIASGGGYSENGKTVNNSINITIPGELYVDFDYWAVILGCVLFGMLIRVLWNACQFHDSPYNFLGAILGGYILYLGLTGISVDLQIVINYLSFYLVFYLLKRIICAYFV